MQYALLGEIEVEFLLPDAAALTVQLGEERRNSRVQAGLQKVCGHQLLSAYSLGDSCQCALQRQAALLILLLPASLARLADYKDCPCLATISVVLR